MVLINSGVRPKRCTASARRPELRCWALNRDRERIVMGAFPGLCGLRISLPTWCARALFDGLRAHSFDPRAVISWQS